MSVKAVKLGGSSLTDASRFIKVKAIMESDPSRLFLIPSAPGKRTYKDEKITDLLLYCYELAKGGKPFEEPFDKIAYRYIDIVQELSLSIDIRAELNLIWGAIKNGASRDYCISRGEYLCSLLIAEFIGFDFIDAAELIRFDAHGRLDNAATQSCISSRLHARQRVVIPGFYGAMPDGTIKAFPRGGSDISGALIARGADVGIYENWTDISAFTLADPRIVKDPCPIREITYSELSELGYMGASVIHPKALFIARQACIPISIRNVNIPSDPGSMILPESGTVNAPGRVSGIAGRRGFTSIVIEKDGMNGETGFGAGVLDILKRHGIPFEHIATGIDNMSVIVEEAALSSKRSSVVDSILGETCADSVELKENIALIATAGLGIMSDMGICAKLFGALSNANVHVKLIDQSSSGSSIIVGVGNDELDIAVRAIHDAFRWG